MFSLLGLLAGALKFFNGISGGISSYLNKKVDAQVEKYKVDGVTDVASLQALAAMQKSEAAVVIAEQGHWVTRWVRPAWAFPFVIWTWKVILYDAVLGLGSSPDLKGIPGQLMLVVAASYFGGRSIEKVAEIIRRKRG